MIPSDENSNMPFLRTNKGLRIKTKDLKLALVKFLNLLAVKRKLLKPKRIH